MSRALLLVALLASCVLRAAEPPNVILIFCDDLGYADIGPFGAKAYATPNLDRLAREGARLTSFYVSSPVCSASRAALLTGCYHSRVGIHGALGPESKSGLNPEETTLAEIAKSRGYATCMVGKWHLGSRPSLLPVRQGFDEWFGIPYSHDMWPHHPEAKPGAYPPLPLLDGDRVIDSEVTPGEADSLTTRYTGRAVSFIERNKAKPFFLYLAHSLPHVPLAVNEARRGKSGAGLYGDVIAELDWSLGEILAALTRHQLDEKTLIVFTSDNGPWLSYGDHAGSALPLREGKGTAWDGGVRVPFLARWPGKIAPGRTSDEPTMTIDVLPTVARLIGAELPPRKIDGRDLWPLLTQDGARSSHEALFFHYASNELQAMRAGQWKLVFPHTYRTLGTQPRATGGKPAKYSPAKTGLELYDLTADIAEARNVAAEKPEIVARLQALAGAMRAELGDSLTKTPPAAARPPGTSDEPRVQ